ncbi:MAG: acyl carrier protein [Bacteroidales bacterium]|nr:acyl carrier protein [Bacteroidales bacterium]
MTLEEFVSLFAEQFDDTPAEVFTPETKYSTLDEWGSLVALSVISMVDEEMDKSVSGSELKKCSTIEELYNLIEAK